MAQYPRISQKRSKFGLLQTDILGGKPCLQNRSSHGIHLEVTVIVNIVILCSVYFLEGLKEDWFYQLCVSHKIKSLLLLLLLLLLICIFCWLFYNPMYLVNLSVHQDFILRAGEMSCIFAS